MQQAVAYMSVLSSWKIISITCSNPIFTCLNEIYIHIQFEFTEVPRLFLLRPGNEARYVPSAVANIKHSYMYQEWLIVLLSVYEIWW